MKLQMQSMCTNPNEWRGILLQNEKAFPDIFYNPKPAVQEPV